MATRAARASSATERERVFFEGDGVTVTHTRFIVPGQTFAMAGVTSVRLERIEPSRGYPIIMALAGLVFLAIAELRWLGLLLLVFGVGALALLKPDFTVTLTTSSGEVQAIKHRDSAFIEEIVHALNNAIVHRG